MVSHTSYEYYLPPLPPSPHRPSRIGFLHPPPLPPRTPGRPTYLASHSSHFHPRLEVKKYPPATPPALLPPPQWAPRQRNLCRGARPRQAHEHRGPGANHGQGQSCSSREIPPAPRRGPEGQRAPGPCRRFPIQSDGPVILGLGGKDARQHVALHWRASLCPRMSGLSLSSPHTDVYLLPVSRDAACAHRPTAAACARALASPRFSPSDHVPKAAKEPLPPCCLSRYLRITIDPPRLSCTMYRASGNIGWSPLSLPRRARPRHTRTYIQPPHLLAALLEL